MKVNYNHGNVLIFFIYEFIIWNKRKIHREYLGIKISTTKEKEKKTKTKQEENTIKYP